MTLFTCRLTAKNRDQLRNPLLGNRVWATFTFYVFGRQANPSDADQIYSAINSRAQKLRSSTGAAAAAARPSSPAAACKDTSLPASSSSVSSTAATEKRSSECVTDNDLAVAGKRQRSVFTDLLTLPAYCALQGPKFNFFIICTVFFKETKNKFFKLLGLNLEFCQGSPCVVNATVGFLTYCLHRSLQCFLPSVF